MPPFCVEDCLMVLEVKEGFDTGYYVETKVIGYSWASSHSTFCI